MFRSLCICGCFVQCFVELGYSYNQQGIKLYRENLQRQIVEAAGDFYKYKSRQWMDQDRCPTYALSRYSKILIGHPILFWTVIIVLAVAGA